MTTKEAIQAMLDGEKVRDVKWAPEEYIYISEGDIVCEKGTKLYSFNVANTDWEIYEEPKQKQTVIIEKWLVTDGKRIDVISTSNIGEYTRNSKWTPVKLLDTYEVKL